MAYRSRYYSQADLDSIVADADRRLDEQAQQDRQAQQLAQLDAFMRDPYYKTLIDNDPMVRAIRAQQMPQGAAPQPTRTTGATLPAVIRGDAKFDPNHLKMRPATPQIDAVKDSYVHSPGATVRQR